MALFSDSPNIVIKQKNPMNVIESKKMGKNRGIVERR
jgi:hypothetical protein